MSCTFTIVLSEIRVHEPIWLLLLLLLIITIIWDFTQYNNGLGIRQMFNCQRGQRFIYFFVSMPRASPVIHIASYPVSNGYSFRWRQSLQFISQHHGPHCSFSSRRCERRRPDRWRGSSTAEKTWPTNSVFAHPIRRLRTSESLIDKAGFNIPYKSNS